MKKLLLTPRQKIVFSLLVGVLTAVAGWRYLVHQEKKIKNQYSMTTVLEARKYIKEGRAVDVDLVEEVPIPVAYLPPMAVQNKTELVDASGQARFATRIGLLKGEPISKSKLIETGAMRGLAWTLSPGQTALALKLSPEQAVAGLLRPGDNVNVYCTLDQQPGWPKDRTRLLFEHITVLAVLPNNRNANDELPPVDNMFVTLSLSPSDAALATLAADKGRIVLALASPLDQQIRSARPVELLDLR